MLRFLIPPAYADINIGDTFGPAKTFPSFGQLINILLPNVLTIAGVIAFIFVIVAGFKMVTHAGSGDAKELEGDKNALTSALIGLLLIFCAFFIIQVMSILLGYNILSPKIGP